MAQVRLHPVILCGGAGSRLWPVSRASSGKPFARFLGGKTLFAETLERVRDPERFAEPVVVCNEAHRFLAAEQLRQEGLNAAALILEPAGRNTAPAVAVAALAARAADPEAALLVLPSDHLIAEPGRFLEAVGRAAPLAAEGWLVTFGIRPDRPETGYGYIEPGPDLPDLAGCYRVDGFVEKPDAATAEGYLAGGRHLWNSGILLCRAESLIEELSHWAPEVLTAARRALEDAERDLDFTRLAAEAYDDAPGISIDHALMEKTERAAVVPVDMGWTDAGSWESLWQAADKDAEHNVVQGDVWIEDTTGSFLRSDRGLLAALGLRDLVAVVQEDAVLVCPRDRAQEVWRITERLAAAGRPEQRDPVRVLRPWGSLRSLFEAEGFRVRHLVLAPGASISLQRHSRRSEHWVVVKGVAEVVRDQEVFRLKAGQSTYLPERSVHRLRNPGDAPLQIVEVQCGGYLGEDDIERVRDGDRAGD